jgi:S-adenosylmethionine decarboxylase
MTTTSSNIGRHLVLDLYDVNLEHLGFMNKTDDTKSVWDHFVRRWIREANATCLDVIWHDFHRDGAFTALYLLAESHMSIHTWPERGYVAIDLFTCGDCDVSGLADKLIDYFEPKSKTVTEIARGEGLR